jgi:hypothetical protein
MGHLADRQRHATGGADAIRDGRDADAALLERLPQMRGDLERQVAAEASGSVLRQFQANFNAAIDTASQSLQQRMEANAAEAGPNAAEERQVSLLEQINRNGQIGTVEILN